MRNLAYTFKDGRLVEISSTNIDPAKIYNAYHDKTHGILNCGYISAYSLLLYSKPIKKCKVFDSLGSYDT